MICATYSPEILLQLLTAGFGTSGSTDLPGRMRLTPKVRSGSQPWCAGRVIPSRRDHGRGVFWPRRVLDCRGEQRQEKGAAEMVISPRQPEVSPVVATSRTIGIRSLILRALS